MEIVTINLPNGRTLQGYKNEYVISRVVENQNYYEYDWLDKWFRVKADNPIIYDIGANLGNHTIYFADHAKTAQIYAFEPVTANYNLLDANVKANNFTDRVTLFNNAIGAEKGHAFMQIPEGNAGNFGMMSIVKGQPQNAEKVEVVVIDELNLPTPDYVKIDTEGFEVNVLKGMKNTLAKADAVVWIEIEIANAMEVNELMSSIGYGIIDLNLYNMAGRNFNCIFTKPGNKLFETNTLLSALIKQGSDLSRMAQKGLLLAQQMDKYNKILGGQQQ